MAAINVLPAPVGSTAIVFATNALRNPSICSGRGRVRVRPTCEIPRNSALGITSLIMGGVVEERGVTGTGRRAGAGTVREKGS